MVGCGIKSLWPTFKSETSVYQSKAKKANLNVELFGKITLVSDPEIRQMLVKSLYGKGTRTLHSIFGP